MVDNIDVKDFTTTLAKTVRTTDNAGVHTPWHATVGEVAHDSPDANNPVKVGAKARSTLSGLTLVASDDRTNVHADLDGAIIFRQNSCLGDIVTGHATDTTGNSTQCIAAQGSGIKTYLTDITLCNSDAANDITVDIKDGTTIVWSFPVPALSGVTHRFASPLPGTANTAWNFDGSAAVTTLTCSMAGFKSKV